ncbi:MAG: hypothetical protein JSW52_11650 [Candidatus Coatesbacteria bacterium]|nr:MAG: hypothetical protein JSW52_11650 [Candidatus Coatesbacteria bacterium]
MVDGAITKLEGKEERLFDLLESLAITYLYIISVTAPYMGLVFGIVLMKKAVLEKDRQHGKAYTVISSIMLGLLLLCCVGYIAGYALMALMVLGYGMAHAPPGY